LWRERNSHIESGEDQARNSRVATRLYGLAILRRPELRVHAI